MPLVVALGVALLAGCLAGAQPHRSGDSTAPVADAYVSADAPDRNYGDSRELWVDDSPAMHAYLRFEVPASSWPVARATLALEVTRPGEGVVVHALDDDAWNESTITFRNAPPVGSVIATAEATAAGHVAADVTPLLDGPGWFSLALLPAGTKSQALASRESPRRAPRLELEGVGSPDGAEAFYVDSLDGNDDHAGTSPGQAWRTLSRANAARLGPGDRLLLRREGRWTGPLEVRTSGTDQKPVVIAPYGSGTPPVVTGASTCIDVEGSHIVVTGVEVRDCGWAGIAVSGASHRVEDNLVADTAAGIYVRSGSSHTRVLRNRLTDNNRMSVLTPAPANDDSGAFGVLIHGDDTEVAYNTISGSHAFSYDYAWDGAAVEIYGGRNNHIHHNVAVDNDVFAELGDARAAGNTFAYNVVRSAHDESIFLVTRGAESPRGPVLRTEAVHNTVLLTGAKSQGVVCHAGCSPAALSLRNNVIQAVAKSGYADGPFDEDHNLFFGGPVNFPLGAHSSMADPRFVDPAAGDLHLRPDSPGVDRGAKTPYQRDADGAQVPQDGDSDGIAAPDLGAFEVAPPPRNDSGDHDSASAGTPGRPGGGPRTVTASTETDPVPSPGDAADDMAVWVAPGDSARSLIFGTDKRGGLAVYDLSGRQLHYYADSRPNGVDTRTGFPLGERRADLVVTTATDSDTLRVYAVDPQTRSLDHLSARPITTGMGVSGLCLYHSPRTGKYFAFATDSSGTVQQWELFHDGAGRVDARKVRQFRVDSTAEACVADDERQRLYLAEEDTAIWSYPAEPAETAAPRLVDGVAAGRLTPDIEGLALYRDATGAGYLFASSQGNDTFVVYQRDPPHHHVLTFTIVRGTVDGVTHTDGIEVVSSPLGDAFPHGAFLAQDDLNDAANQNFKLVPYDRISSASP